MDDGIWDQDSDASLVIRTDFSRSQEWEEIQVAIAEPQTKEEFTAFVAFVDDRAFENITPPQLVEMVPADSDHAVAFLVDAETLTHPDRPILVVNLDDEDDEDEDDEDDDEQGQGPQYSATFRVVPSEMWSVQNNLTIANMDWEDFAENVDGDGIFRGFK
ncbi:hypothetical protein EYA84_11085 [Verrucosispora sp. SN26_14.1]|uniref:DUF6924 domain-containing protein n=1 Tax=Verrucosispora sp. SN26_14.1 TaxID=2527879 RepID=UPI001033CE1C|nr:hypothetical protein [Verrucosispora sp. SN26_14.1]TBL37173.1 hypothetical protein EYA84_11085 [Verrucosispora sp. SN26_14.1]